MMTEIPGEVFADVWDALEDSPAVAANMRLRSELMRAVQDAVREWKVTKMEAARRLELAPAKMEDLQHGRVGKFSVDELLPLAERVGLHVRVQVEHAPP